MSAAAEPELSPRRRWSSVAALAVAETVSWGVLFYTFGVLLPAMETDFGVGRTWLTAIFSAALLVGGLAAAPTGRWLDRWGARRVMTIGAIAASVLLVGWSRADSFAALALVWLGLGFAHALVLYEPAFVAVTRWFAEPRERARALLAITLMAGLASTIFLPVAGALLVAQGWRTTVLVLAGIVAFVTIPVHASLPRHHGSSGAERARPGGKGGAGVERGNQGADADGLCDGSTDTQDQTGSAPSSGVARGFGWVIAAFALHGVIAGAMVVHAVPLITEAGRSPARAAAMVGMFGVFQVAGRLVSTAWWERMPPAWRVSVLLGGQGLAMVALILARFDAAVWVFVVSFGVSNGLLTLARPLTVGEWATKGNFGTVSGRVAAWAQVTRAVAPLLASGVHAAGGGYPSVAIGLAGVAAAGMWAARVAERRRAEEIPASVGALARQQG